MAEWKNFIPTSDGLKKAANNILGFPLSRDGSGGFELVGNLIVEAGPYVVFGLTALNRVVLRPEFNLWQASAFAMIAFGAKAVVEGISQRANIYGETLDPGESLSSDFLERLETELNSRGHPDVASRIMRNLRDRPRH